jgi:arylsulfatase A-like enzyme
MSEPRPNILLLLCDQLTARVMRLYGGPVAMPNVERLATGGVVLRNAYASSVACGPSRACLFTGQYPHAHGIAHNVDRRDYALAPWAFRVPASEEGIRAADSTLGSCLYDAGYDTRYYGKWHLLGEDLPYYPDMYTEKDYLDEMSATFAANRRRDHMDWCGMVLPVEQTPAMRDALGRLGDRWDKLLFKPFATKMGRLLGIPLDDLFDVRAVRKAVAFLDNAPAKPFALTCSLIYPHDPYVIPSPYYEMFDPDALELPANFAAREPRFENDWTREFVRGLGEAGLREWVRIYYGAIRFVDDQVGRVLDALDRNGLADDTVVVFTADHGDMAGAHGMAWKNTSALYEEIVRVPLIIRAPGTLTPDHTDILTANVDLLPTLLSLAGVEAPTGCEGQNLIPALTGGQEPPPFVVCEVLRSHPGRLRSVEPGRPANFMIRDARWKLVRYDDGDEFIYDLADDPLETTNRIAGTDTAPVAAELRAALAAWRQESRNTDRYQRRTDERLHWDGTIC